jgi:hypothetical protein
MAMTARPIVWLGLAACTPESATSPERADALLSDAAQEVRVVLALDWTGDPGSQSALFGSSVAGAGDVNADGFDDVLVGSPTAFDPSGFFGAPAVYLGSVDGVENDPVWIGEWQEGDPYDPPGGLSAAVSHAGDVNGDGFDDVLVGRVGKAPESAHGAAVVFHGSDTGPETTPAWEYVELDGVLGFYDSNEFGSALSSGDVNGDGFDDVIVGAAAYRESIDTTRGRTYVFFGSSEGLELAASWIVAAGGPDAQFGESVCSGDVNGDGFDDVIVGAPGDHTVLAYHGASTGPSTTADWTMTDDALGESVGCGDFDGDGFDDVVAAAVSVTLGIDSIHVVRGSAVGLEAVPAWSVDGLGSVVASAGDVDADGDEEILIGDPGQDNATGAAHLILGAPTGPESEPVWSSEGQTLSSFGAAVSSAGDINGDGRSDVIVGSPEHDFGEGEAYVYVGTEAREPLVLVTEPWIVGAATTATVTGGPPFGDVMFVTSIGGPGSGPCPPPLGGVCLDVLRPFPKVQRVTADATGAASWTMTVPATLPVGAHMWLQAVAGGRKSNVDARTTE